jgi:hypothetical protein
MLGVSLLSPATSFARKAVEAKVRIAAREQAEDRVTAPNGRATASRIAIVGVDRVVRLRSAGGWGGRPVVMMSSTS